MTKARGSPPGDDRGAGSAPPPVPAGLRAARQGSHPGTAPRAPSRRRLPPPECRRPAPPARERQALRARGQGHHVEGGISASMSAAIAEEDHPVGNAEFRRQGAEHALVRPLPGEHRDRPRHLREGAQEDILPLHMLQPPDTPTMRASTGRSKRRRASARSCGRSGPYPPHCGSPSPAARHDGGHLVRHGLRTATTRAPHQTRHHAGDPAVAGVVIVPDVVLPHARSPARRRGGRRACRRAAGPHDGQDGAGPQRPQAAASLG